MPVFVGERRVGVHCSVLVVARSLSFSASSWSSASGSPSVASWCRSCIQFMGLRPGYALVWLRIWSGLGCGPPVPLAVGGSGASALWWVLGTGVGTGPRPLSARLVGAVRPPWVCPPTWVLPGWPGRGWSRLALRPAVLRGSW